MGAFVEAIFFGFIYLYCFAAIDPRLVLQGQQPVFFFNYDFAAPFFNSPGGPVQYLSLLMTQGLDVGWAGSLLLTAFAVGLSFSAWHYLSAFNPRFACIFWLVPAVVWMSALHFRTMPVLAWMLGLFLVGIASALHGLLIHRSMGWRLLLLLAGSASVYYLAGSKYVLGFAALFLVLEVWTVARRHFGRKETAKPAESSPKTIGLGKNKPATPAKTPSVVPGHASSTGRPILQFIDSVLGQAAIAGLWILITIAAGYRLENLTSKGLLAEAYFAEKCDWQAVLIFAPDLMDKPSTAEVMEGILNVNLALLKTGRLAEEQFRYAQFRSFALPYGVQEVQNWGVVVCDIMMALGQVNYGEHWAYETLELNGDHPALLKRLADIQILKGNVESARVFLNLLAQNPVSATEARHKLDMLKTDPLGTNDLNLATLRKVVVGTDHPTHYLPLETLIGQCLPNNRPNRLAYEFLMSSYLLTDKLDDFIANLPRMAQYDYPNIPRHWEEAILMQQRIKSMPPLDLRGKTIRSETVRDFEDFFAISRPFGQDLKAMKVALKPRFAKTFWYFYLFGQTPSENSGMRQGSLYQ